MSVKKETHIFPRFWLDASPIRTFVFSYVQLKDIMDKISEVSAIDGKEYTLNAKQHVFPPHEEDKGLDFSTSEFYANSELTLREWAKTKLNKEELEKIGVIL
jgi:hypothetical protein